MIRLSRHVVALTILTLTGCSTVQGVGHDLESLLSRKTLEKDTVVARIAGACPPVRVAENLDSLSEFENIEKNRKRSDIAITDINRSCNIQGTDIDMEIALTFTGTLGPEARIKKDDSPSFAYPYFIAVTDEEGFVLAKEIFAASLAYGPEQDTLIQTETIHQKIPLVNENGNTATAYTVLTGFQLTERQLAYNQARAAAAVQTAAGEEEAENNGTP